MNNKTDKMMTSITIETETPSLLKAYANRLSFLRKQWNDLMEIQDTMSIDEIIKEDFQTKKNRIGGLYHRTKDMCMAPERKAFKDALRCIGQPMHNLPQGMTSLTIK